MIRTKERPLTKEDKKFLITMSINNRDFLTNIGHRFIAVTLTFMAIYISLCSYLISTIGLNNLTILTIVLITIFAAIIFRFLNCKTKETLKNAKKCNEQYQKYLFEVYPHLQKEGFYH